jgi:glycosyltransferase involved in cell wall biosynthesis
VKIASLTILVAVRNEEAMLPGCLARLGFADEVLVIVDDRTSDASEQIAIAAGAQVLKTAFKDFASFKNLGIEASKSDWVLVVDADERVSAALAREVRSLDPGNKVGFSVPIVNYFYGHMMRFGGWQERPIRLFRADTTRYFGELHETPRFSGGSTETGDLSAPLHHFSHRSVIENLEKTARFGEVQARELHATGAPPVKPRNLYWTVIREILHRLVMRQGWRDGTPGVIESLYQPLSLLAVKARLWELQQDPSIQRRYEDLEAETS